MNEFIARSTTTIPTGGTFSDIFLFAQNPQISPMFNTATILSRIHTHTHINPHIYNRIKDK